MKKSLSFLILLLISLFVTPQIYAMSISDYSTSLMYSEEALEIMTTYETKINTIISRLESQDTWCRNTLCYKISDGIYAPIIQLSTLSTDDVVVYLSKVNNASSNFYVSTIYSDNNVNDDRIFIQYGQLQVHFNFTDNVLTGTSVSGSGNKSYQYYYSASLNPTLANITKTISDYYFYPNFLNNNVVTTFKVWDTSLPNTYYSIPLKVSDTIYTPPTTIPTKAFFESFMPNIEPVNPTNCTAVNKLGSTLNVNSLIFRVRGQSSALDYPNEGYFDMRSENFSSSTDITSQFTLQSSWGDGSEIEENFNVDAYLSYDTDRNILRLNYSILNQDDTTANFDIRFIVVANNTQGIDFLESELGIYTCPTGNNYTNVSYGYKDKITGQNISVDPTIFNALNNSSVNGSTGYFQDFFENTIFNEDFGLTPIVQAPLNFISNYNSAVCNTLVIPLPRLGNVNVPCMSSIYNNYIPTIYTILKLVINGIITYRMALYVVSIIKNAQDPDDDKIEVMNL